MRLRLPRLASALGAVLCVAWTQAFDVTAQRAVILEETTGKVLWSKDPDAPAFPASTTKIMTALLLVEGTKPDDWIAAPADVETVTGSSMHLVPGERIRARDLLAALMLRSANDGAHAVAVHLAGSDEAFAEKMNERARQIGCRNTSFHNPHGLNDEQHTVSALDLALIAREAMKHEAIREIAATRRKRIERSLNLEDTLMVSRNKWLAEDPTADGIKTGYTAPAGHCFVGSATRDGYRLITVVLDSEDWVDDNRRMLDWAFGAHERVGIYRAGAGLAELPIDNGRESEVAVGTSSPAWAIVSKGASPHVELSLDLPQGLAAPVRAGQRVGEAEIRDSEGFVQRIPLVALAAVPVASPLQRAGAMLVQAGPWVLFAGIGAFALRKQKSRRRRIVGRITSR